MGPCVACLMARYYLRISCRCDYYQLPSMQLITYLRHSIIQSCVGPPKAVAFHCLTLVKRWTMLLLKDSCADTPLLLAALICKWITGASAAHSTSLRTTGRWLPMLTNPPTRRLAVSLTAIRVLLCYQTRYK